MTESLGYWMLLSIAANLYSGSDEEYLRAALVEVVAILGLVVVVDLVGALSSQY